MYFAIAYYTSDATKPVVLITKDANEVIGFMDDHNGANVTVYKTNGDTYELLAGRALTI